MDIERQRNKYSMKHCSERDMGISLCMWESQIINMVSRYIFRVWYVYIYSTCINAFKFTCTVLEERCVTIPKGNPRSLNYSYLPLFYYLKLLKNIMGFHFYFPFLFFHLSFLQYQYYQEKLFNKVFLSSFIMNFINNLCPNS